MTQVSAELDQQERCRVCARNLGDERFQSELSGVVYDLCSERCRARFEAHHTLYLGNPRDGLAVKQAGQEDVKQHRIVFTKPIPILKQGELKAALRLLQGIKSVSIASEKVNVTYDLLVISLADIESHIEHVLGEIDSPLTEKLKRAWIHYSEECELDNLGQHDF